ncbi:MAG: hypothetical protein Q4F95_08445 [Oscillospiraceae bacterium]|nr:hypothetical protein [Oscillospiraceae bacterium]
MSLTKRITAAVVALSCMLTAAGCGESTSWAVKYGDYKLSAGIFLFYQTQAYSEATTRLSKDNENLDLKDTKTLKTMSIDGQNFTDWVNNKATESMRTYLAVQEKFDTLGLSLESEDVDQINSMADSYWSYYSTQYEQNGIGKETFKNMVEFDYKQKEVFEYYYGEGGEKEYSVDDMKSYLEENKARVKYIQLNLRDGSGTELDDAGKEEISDMADDYAERAKKGENFDDLITEYNDYYKKLQDDAAAKAEAATTTTAAEETTAADTTSSGEQTTAADDSSAADTEETTADSNNDGGPVTETSQTNQTETVTTTAAEEDEDTETASAETSQTTTGSDDEESAETEDDTADTDTEDAEEEDPYANENIITKGNEDDGYQPSQTVNEAIFNDAKVDGDPVIVKDEDNLYVYVIERYDILERTDLIEGDNKDSLLWEILNEDFTALTLEWVPDSAINKNKMAYKRYDPFKLKFN